MALYRPTIPVEVKCRVAMRQLGEFFPDAVIVDHRGALGRLLTALLDRLADLLGCTVAELRLDHNPALALRKRHGRGRTTIYMPPANDPEYLSYRPHGAQHAGSHDVKTRIRGDRGQFSDMTLIKRERRRAKKKAAPVKRRPKNDKRNRAPVKGRTVWAKGRKLPTKKDRKWKR